MDVEEARRKILIPMFRWMLEQKTYCIIEYLREIAQQQDIVILDDSINCDITNINVPLSYAWLIKSYIEDKIGKLDKYFEDADAIVANVVIKVRGKEQKMEITIKKN